MALKVLIKTLIRADALVASRADALVISRADAVASCRVVAAV